MLKIKFKINSIPTCRYFKEKNNQQRENSQSKKTIGSEKLPQLY